MSPRRVTAFSAQTALRDAFSQCPHSPQHFPPSWQGALQQATPELLHEVSEVQGMLPNSLLARSVAQT
jgi:hypothetical protein